MSTREPADGAPQRPAPGRGRLARLLRPRLRRVDLLIAALLLVLGFAAVVQVRSTQEDGVLASARQEDLVRILDDLSSRSERLRQEVTTLTGTRERLLSDDGSAAALDEARRRTEVLGVLAGTVPARGPGVRLTVDDPEGDVRAEVLLDALQELRDAGAEAVELQGRGGDAVRVLAGTSLQDAEGGVLVDGVVLSAPYVFVALGDSSTLSSALGIPGGVLDTVEAAGGAGRVEEGEDLRVGALRPLEEPRYARPVPD